MVSTEKLVEEMLRPLEEVYILMRDKINPKSPELEKTFILHKQQWNFLAQVYIHTVDKIKRELLRMLEPLMATLHGLFSVMKAAEKAFLECVAPHVGFPISFINWLQSVEEKQMKDLQLWMVKDALRHILDCQVLRQDIPHLLIASVAVYEALLHVNYLNLLGDARRGKDLPALYSYCDDALVSNGIPVIYTRNPPTYIEELRRVLILKEDVASARRFFTSSVANETDPHLAEMILERLGSRTIGEKLAAGIERLKMNPTQFQKTDRKLGSLGKGNFGTVKLRSWISDKHQVAVKEGAIGSEEMEIQARVRHPNVLPLLCCTSKENDEKSLLLVMERMDSNLDKLIEDASRGAGDHAGPPFPLPVSVEIMLQIATGMYYLHYHGIIHRDLKPANILVSGYHSITSSDDDPLQFLRVKVADFGASKDNFKTFDAGNTYKMGSGFYRAPEVMNIEESNAGYGRKADVYSFAMVCYRILSGKEPFHDYHSSPLPRDLYERIQKGELRPKFGFESNLNCMALVGMVQQCWRSDASERPDFAQIEGFLRFIKICVLQQPMIFQNSIEWRPDLLELLKSVDLFSTFCQVGSSIEALLLVCASRKIKGRPGES